MSSLLLILLSAVLVCHYAPVLAGMRPFEQTDAFDNAVGIAFASLIALTAIAPVGFLIEHQLLARFQLGYLRTFALVIVVMIVAHIVAFGMRRSTRWTPVKRPFVLLMTAHCAVLGVALVTTARAASLTGALLFGAVIGLAFGALLLAFTTLQQRLLQANVPRVFRDAPAAVITVGLMALAFMGFTGLIRD